MAFLDETGLQTLWTKIKNTFALTTHSHGNILSDGKVGSAATKPLITSTGGVVVAGDFGTTAGTFCQGNDSRVVSAITSATASSIVSAVHANGTAAQLSAGTDSAYRVWQPNVLSAYVAGATVTSAGNATTLNGSAASVYAKTTDIKTYTGASGVTLTGSSFSHTTGEGWGHIPSGGSAGQILEYSGAGVAQWVDPVIGGITSAQAVSAVSAAGYTTSDNASAIASAVVSSGGYAIDSNVVHISGSEHIIGAKTFSSGVTAPHYYVGYEGILPLHTSTGLDIHGVTPMHLDNANIHIGSNTITLTGDGGSSSGYIGLYAPYIDILGSVSTTLGPTKIYSGATISGGVTVDNANINYTISSGGSNGIVIPGENADFIVGRDYPEYGAGLLLEGRHGRTDGGKFVLKTGGADVKNLVGSVDGTLTWTGNTISATTFSGTATSATSAGNATTVNGTAGSSALSWNTEVTLYTVGGHAVKAKLPANPNTNTTYTFATGDSNGQIKVTPSGGTAQNVSVKGLGTAAYTSTGAFLSTAGGTVNGNVTVSGAFTVPDYIGASNLYCRITTSNTSSGQTDRVIRMNTQTNGNMGIYDINYNKWLLRADSAGNIYMSGHATTAGSCTGNAANVTGTVAIANGGTGATSAVAARTNLGFTSGTTAAASGTTGVIYFQYS